MNKNRLEAFSDGVLAIIVTIMVLELKVPHGSEFSDLAPIAPVFLSYALSFIYVAIYWTNHHHLFQVVKHVNGPILWANMHLLFWLSLIPFATAWLGESHLATTPVATYGVALLMPALAYFILTKALLAEHSKDSELAQAMGTDFKGKISLVFYAAGIPLTFYSPYIAMAFYVLVAAVWIVPDKRVERVLRK